MTNAAAAYAPGDPVQVVDGPFATFTGVIVTETFFDKPLQLQSKHHTLYRQLQQFYRQDPAARQHP